MRKMLIIAGFLLIPGCAPADKPATHTSPADRAIINLSRTTDQLDSIHREKDFLINVLEDLETQQAVYSPFLDDPQLTLSWAQAFDNWRANLFTRERTVATQHALNVLVAHVQATRSAPHDQNEIPSIGAATHPALNDPAWLNDSAEP